MSATSDAQYDRHIAIADIRRLSLAIGNAEPSSDRRNALACLHSAFDSLDHGYDVTAQSYAERGLRWLS
jgi:hypothetical protein